MGFFDAVKKVGSTVADAAGATGDAFARGAQQSWEDTSSYYQNLWDNFGPYGMNLFRNASDLQAGKATQATVAPRGRLANLATGGKVVHGPALIHVGERKVGDPKYATDEYLYAMPGSIVAPRKHTEKPTPRNAARAIVAKGKELGILHPSTTPEDLMNGGSTMNGPSAYKSYAKTAGRAPRLGKAKAGTGVRFATKRPVKRGSGPRIFNRLTGADAGAAVDPYSEALRAIQAVASSGNMTPEAAAGVLNNPQENVVTSQGPQTSIPVAEGAASMSDFLKNLLGGAGLTGPDLLLAQMSIMNSLGQVDPRALGVTDPAKFRSLLAEGQGFNTLDKNKQLFNESLYGFQQSSPSRRTVPTVSGG